MVCGLGDARLARAIVLLSGGVDSAVALWWAKGRGWDVEPLTFSYFGRPRNEDVAIDALVVRAGVRPPRHVDLPFLKEVDDLRKEGFGNRVLVDSPEGYIPARNLIFYSLAAYFAEIEGIRYLVGGHNGIDPKTFPDSSPDFFGHVNSLYRLGLWSYGKAPVAIKLPLAGKPKEEVVGMGRDLGVPFDRTWSCYFEGAKHCGRCPSCLERKAAFRGIGLEDPVAFEE